MRMRFIRTVLLAIATLFVSTACFAQVGVSITIAPPEIPVYDQPVCPGDGYLWTPGYWAYGDVDEGYYWVPGTWVLPPEVGFFWTPAYWGWGDGGFIFYQGYWGPEIGFYGGINYGFGYFGNGYEGGRWDHGHFFYNTTVNNINVTVIHNVYNERVTVNNSSRVSFNGGRGGITARPTSREEAFAHERHVAPVAAQVQHAQAARSDPQQRFSVNHGAPAVAATPKPGAFKDREVVAAKPAGGAARSEGNARSEEAARPEGDARASTAVHPKDLPPIEHPPAPNTGNAKLDQKYQKQQDRLVAKQQQDREKLQKQQDQEHQRLAKQNADDARKQQVEQTHQQQTQQMVQRHTQQTQQMQQRQAPAPRATESKPRG